MKEYKAHLVAKLEKKNQDPEAQAESLRQSQEQLRLQATVLETVANAIIITDAEGTILWVNPSFTALTGYPAQEAVGKTPRILKSGKHDALFYRALWKTILSGHTWRGEFTNRRKDGSLYYGEETITPVKSEAGMITRFVGIMNDVTERKEAQEKLRLAHEKLRHLLTHSPAVIYSMKVVGENLVPTIVSDNMERLLGYTAAESARYEWWLGSLHPEDRDRVLAVLAKGITGEGYSVEYRIRHKDGSYRWVEDNNRVVRDLAGKPTETVGVWTDITERKRDELRVAAFSGLGRKMNSAKTVQEAGEIIIEVADELFGWDACTVDLYSAEKDQILHVLNRDTINDRRVAVPPRFDAVPPTPRARRVIERGAQLILREDPGAIPEGIPFGDTARLSASIMLVPIRDGGKSIGVLSIQSYQAKRYTAPDMEGLQSLADYCGGAFSRIKAAQELRESEERYRDLFENAHDLIQSVSPDGRLLFVNRAWRETLGYNDEELTRLRMPELVHPDGRKDWEELARQALAGRPIKLAETEFVSKSGKRIALEGSVGARLVGAEPVSLRCIFRDVTEKKKLEAQFLRNQRMESIGTLAGGIAHDLNNALAPVLLSIHVLQMKFTDAEGALLLDTIASSTQRAADMVKQVLTFSRGLEGKRGEVQLRHLIKEMQNIIRQTFPKSVQLRTEIARDLWTVVGDGTQLHQVLLNLCVNARDAMPRGGTLSIKTGNAMLDEQFAGMSPEAKAGPYVMISVADTGTGIPPHVRERIFEPFFTTKPLGQGTGLGLSTVQGIIKGHGGFISLNSAVGKGSAFQVYLPANPAGGKTDPESELTLLPAGKGELILIVDDEASVRSITQQTLETFGYRVLSANDGAQAVAACAQNRGKIKLMLTDMMMPVMDGAAAIRAVRTLDPGIKIIAASGIPLETSSTDSTQFQANAVLQKPFTAERLLNLIREVLDGPAEALPAPEK